MFGPLEPRCSDNIHNLKVLGQRYSLQGVTGGVPMSVHLSHPGGPLNQTWTPTSTVQLLLCHAAGPAFVYGCYWGAVPAYILAELLGGIAAALISWPLYGTGLQLGRCALLSGYLAASCISSSK